MKITNISTRINPYGEKYHIITVKDKGKTLKYQISWNDAQQYIDNIVNEKKGDKSNEE